MCDPLSIGVLSAVGTVASAGISYMGQQSALDAQRKANADWVAYQRAQSQKAAAEDEAQRQKASAAEQTTLQKLSPQSQEQTQQTSQANLTQNMLAGSPAAPDSNVQLLGGGDPADTSVTQDLSSRVTDAARQAQGRIQALAALTSYGGGYGTMGDVAQSAINQGKEDIGLTGDLRTGIAQTLGVAQQVQPEQFVQGSNIAGSVASSLAGIAGNAFGTAMKKTS